MCIPESCAYLGTRSDSPVIFLVGSSLDRQDIASAVCHSKRLAWLAAGQGAFGETSSKRIEITTGDTSSITGMTSHLTVEQLSLPSPTHPHIPRI